MQLRWLHWFHKSIAMMTSSNENISALLDLYEGNPPVTGGFPLQRPVTRSFGVFFDRRLNKRLGKHSRRGWFETPSRSLWRQCNVCFLYTATTELIVRRRTNHARQKKMTCFLINLKNSHDRLRFQRYHFERAFIEVHCFQTMQLYTPEKLYNLMSITLHHWGTQPKKLVCFFLFFGGFFGRVFFLLFLGGGVDVHD